MLDEKKNKKMKLSRNLKLFFSITLLLNLSPLFIFIPINKLKLLAFIPYLFWINIPGIPLARLGVPFYEIHEFGAVPQNPAGWALIVIFWILIAGLLTLLFSTMQYYLHKKI